MTTRTSVVANGATTTFSVPFPFISRAHVVVTVDGTETTDFSWLSDSSIAFDVAPDDGAEVVIERVTPAAALTAYTRGSALPLADLDVDSKQALYRIEETYNTLERLKLDASFLPDFVSLNLLGWDAGTGAITNYPLDSFVAGVSAGAQFTFTVAAGDTSVDTSVIPDPWAASAVYYNGIHQAPTAWSLSVDGNTLDFSEELPAAGTVVVYAVYITAEAPASSELIESTALVTGGVSRTQREKNGDSLSVKDLGVADDGVTDINAALLAAIGNRPAGKSLRFPAGDYYLVGRIDVTLSSPLDLEFEPGARIVGDGDDVPMLTLRGGAGRHRVVVRGGHFDNGDRVFSGASQTGTALDLIDVDDFLVEGCVFGRSTRDWADNFGDTGITATRCQRGTIRDNTFYGQPDLGVYITGGALTADSDDYGDITISGNRFYRCQSGISAKRQIGRMIATGNTFYECYDGITVFEASSVDPGRMGVIAGNVFKYTQDRAVRIHAGASPAGYVITGNVIEDFGFNRALASVSARGIALRGASGCVVSNNVIRFKDWTSDVNHAAIRLEQTTINTVVYSPANNHVADNLIQGVNIGIVESSAGVNHYPDNTILSATTPLSGLNTGAMGSYFDGTNRYDIVAGTARLPDGTYTPVGTNHTNVAASTMYPAQYSRVGKTVSVSGKFEATCTANSVATEIRLSLPFTTTFTADEQLAGTASPGDVVGAGASGGFCKAEIAGSTCRIRFMAGASATSSRTWFYHFTYRIQ